MMIAKTHARPRPAPPVDTMRPRPADAANGIHVSLCVVVADADPAAAPTYRQTLPRLGHRICSVSTGRELVDVCRAARPDLVIADAGLPGLGDAAEVLGDLSVAVILVGGESAESPLDGSVFARLPRP